MLAQLRAKVESRQAVGLGVRALAETMGVTVPTMRHYFGTKKGVLNALFESYSFGSGEHLEILRSPSDQFAGSIHGAVRYLAEGFRIGPLTEIHGYGIAEGMCDPEVAPTYLKHLFDSVIDAFAARLQAHIDRGQMRQCDAHYAAIQVISPILVVYLHQVGLKGSSDFPIDLDKFPHDLAESFIRSYST